MLSKLVFWGIMCVCLGLCAQTDFPWSKLYQGEDLTGPNVIGCWQFLPGKELEDNSGHGHKLKLRGSKAKFESSGKVGGALRGFGSGPEDDKPQGVIAADKPELTPKGAFSLEVWFKPDEKLFSGSSSGVFLADKKLYNYSRDFERANWDYCLYLTRINNKLFTIDVSLGFKTDSVWAKSKPVELKVDEWRHVAFSYDGNGIIRIFLDGINVGRAAFPGRKDIADGTYGLVLGDRFGSTHNSFPGVISQVRLCKGLQPEFAGKASINVTSGRTVFYRFEKDAALSLTLLNDSQTPLTNIKANVKINGKNTVVSVPDTKAGETQIVPLPVDVTLRPDQYECEATVTGESNGKNITLTTQTSYDIVPRELPFMPVVMWGGGDNERLKYIGFTHNLQGMGDLKKTWDADAPINMADASNPLPTIEKLNKQMRDGLHVCLTTGPGNWVGRYVDDIQYKRVDRTGAPLSTNNAAVAHPRIQRFGYNMGASIAKAFSQFPNFDAALIHSEVRDNTAVSFQDFEVASAEKFLGCKIPEIVTSKNGIPYTFINDFPLSHVIPDSDTILRFYTWFWKNGDGWNPLHTQIHKGLKSTGRKDFWTFFDPAVRVPSVWGSGGEVDILSQWTYSYPDPIKIGQATDELFAMAEGVPGQKVMKMTQIIWYRSQTAPIPQMPEDVNKRVQWEKDIPDAQFITISPDHLSEALWSMIARPVRGIMYHGWGSLFTSNAGSYRHTNPETSKRLSKLVHEIIKPLGPTLLQVPDYKTDVAILESFSSQIFGGGGTYGWSASWEADVHIILQWAGFQPRVIYDETIRKNGLDDYKILVMPNCKVLTESVAKEIQAFQSRGGIVVGDQSLCPAIIPDLILPVYRRTRKADVDKKALQAMAADFAAEMAPFHKKPFASSNQDIVLRLRKQGDADYLFAINDKREFGNYVGQYGLVMEKGLPNNGKITLYSPRQFVYDLTDHKKVNAITTKDSVSFDTSFGPGDGRLFLALPTALEKITVTAPKQVFKGSDFTVTAQISNKSGKAPKAVIPVQVRILDPEKREVEFSGYHAAPNGKLELNLNFATNELPGIWHIVIKDLASGTESTTKIKVF